ncbi:MAG: RNA methyltransferase [Deltaproteobacteria bacterium]|nr:RNA methyltransferase [Deltaproteobacteria bacterium]
MRWFRRLAADPQARRSEGLWVAEGVRLAEEVLRAGVPVRLWALEKSWGMGSEREAALRASAEARGDEVVEVGPEVLRSLADTRSPQGVLCAFEAPSWAPEEVVRAGGPVLVLDGLQDPGNVGTLARSAEAAGAAGLLLTRGSADPGNPKALRASAGSLLRLPHAFCDDPLPTLSAAGRSLATTALAGGTTYFEADLARPFALLIGREGSGVSRDLAQKADLVLTIPMEGEVESLNAATAAAVILVEAARQRRRLGVGTSSETALP